MSKYTDLDQNFKLAHADLFTRVTDRNIMILHKLLNGLTFQDHFHECYLAIHLATDWNRYQDYKALSLWLMAKKLATNNSEAHQTVYDRLKKKWVKFLDLLDSTGLILIEYRRDPRPKKPIEYKYNSDILYRLWNLPLSTTMVQIDLEVEKTISRLVSKAEKKPSRKAKKRSSESIADSIAKMLLQLGEITISKDDYAVELELAQERQGVPADLWIVHRR